MDSSEQLNKRANKRLKVGRACYTCRAKKIKCDGLRPCMQCKARQRPCSFYKDGSLEEETDQDSEIVQQEDVHDMDNTITEHNGLSSSIPALLSAAATTAVVSEQKSTNKVAIAPDRTTMTTAAEESILFAETSTVNHNKLKRRGPLMESRTSNTLNSLGENIRKMTSNKNRLAEKLLNSATTETFGSFIMWMPEPSLPSRYSGSIEMPSREIQLALIDQFFNERHESLLLIIRYYFYEQLENKGLMITPLLLNIIYAHAARFVTLEGCPKTEVFYHRARRLVDDFMDVPRVSTVVALCLLSLYEPSPAIYRPGPHHCRQWQYSGMAFRMVIELGLHCDENVHNSLTPVEIELRRRVFWVCYDLDKFQSGGWERPWMISREIARTARPTLLPDESQEDALLLDAMNAKTDFFNIMEEGLSLARTLQALHHVVGNGDVFLGIQKESVATKIQENHAKHQNWLRGLKPSLQWTPSNTVSVEDLLDLAAPRPVVGHLHLYYNTVSLNVMDRTPSNFTTQFQTRVTAACMTQLCYHLCQTPSYIIKFDFIAHALISAIKIHIRYLDDPDVHLAQQAWVLFDRSILCMQLITGHAVIPNCTKFLQQVQNIYGLHLASSSDGGSSSSSSSPPTGTSRKHPQSTSSPHADTPLSVDPSPPAASLQPLSASIHLDPSFNQQQQPSSNMTSSHTSITTNGNHNNNRILDSSVPPFPDDISQILTNWTSSSSSNNDNRNNNVVYMNTSQSNVQHRQQQMHHSHSQYHHHSFHPPPTSKPLQQRLQPSQDQLYTPSPYQRPHSTVQQPQLSIWNSTTTEYSNKSYNPRDIIVASQLDTAAAAAAPPNPSDILFQRQHPRFNTTTAGGQNGWQQHNLTTEGQDGTTPARGVYMPSRQHYEE